MAEKNQSTVAYDEWWAEPGQGDQSMEDSHDAHWKKFFSHLLPEDITSNSKVLDFGCNQGKMLRLLFDERRFSEGVGVDLAVKSIETANERKEGRPLEYQHASKLAEYKNHFDVALSSAVMYLLPDLNEHASQINSILKQGGVYYASHPDYVNYPNRQAMRYLINQHASCPVQDHTLDDIAWAFTRAGFDVGISRMNPEKFVNITKPGEWYEQVSDCLAAVYDHAYVFRFVKR